MAVQQKNISLPMDVILDSIADGVFTIDTAKNITSFNKAAERITGITRKHAIGQKRGSKTTEAISLQIKR